MALWVAESRREPSCGRREGQVSQNRLAAACRYPASTDFHEPGALIDQRDDLRHARNEPITQNRV